MTSNTHPIMYSFRRCPYAMRARMAIAYAGVQVELREVVLRDKPKSLLAISSKATVPVLLSANGGVLEQSLDIMLWALQQSDKDNWLLHHQHGETEMLALVQQCDNAFKPLLDRYKYFQRHPEYSQSHYREQAEVFLSLLEQRLLASNYLVGNALSLADVAIFPFIRQFANVDKGWFAQCQYARLRSWLDACMALPYFIHAMQAYSQWHEGDAPQWFPPNKIMAG